MENFLTAAVVVALTQQMKVNFETVTKSDGSVIPLTLLREIAEEVLDSDAYELSCVFCDNDLSHELNLKYRGKDKPTNVLSFPLSETVGEMFIDLEQCKKEHKDFNRTLENFISFLFIHGLFHLKGYDHGSTMETAEETVRKKFGLD